MHYRSYKSFSYIFRESLQKTFPQNSVISSVIPYPLIRVRRFSENLACFGFLETPVLRFGPLSYYRRIMLRTRLWNIFVKTKTEDNDVRCAKQINLCVTLLRKSKRILLITLTRKTFATIKSFGKYLSHYYH